MGQQKAIGYLRVSTAEQANGFGLEVQEQAIRSYARDHSIRLVSVLEDAGQSGSNGLDDRPALAQGLADLESGPATALIVYRLDRLARDLVLQETLVQRLAKANVEVVSVTEPDIDSDDPTRVLVRQVLGAIAQYEKAVIATRMAAGRAAKKASGGYAGGSPRYGYTAQDGELVPDPDEQATIARIVELHDRGATLRDIVGVLEAEGRRPKRGAGWYPQTVARVIGPLRNVP